jgi:hypothetical protein
MGRVEARARIKGVDRQRLTVRGKQLLVLCDGSISPSIRLRRFRIDAGTHDRLPRLASVTGTIDSAAKGAVVVLARDSAIEHDLSAPRVGSSREPLDLVPRQSVGLLGPSRAPIVSPPDTAIGRGKSNPCVVGLVEVKPK